eukprot:351147-Chlamydomonas_euryale.AAC.1
MPPDDTDDVDGYYGHGAFRQGTAQRNCTLGAFTADDLRVGNTVEIVRREPAGGDDVRRRGQALARAASVDADDAEAVAEFARNGMDDTVRSTTMKNYARYIAAFTRTMATIGDPVQDNMTADLFARMCAKFWVIGIRGHGAIERGAVPDEERMDKANRKELPSVFPRILVRDCACMQMFTGVMQHW